MRMVRRWDVVRGRVRGLSSVLGSNYSWSHMRCATSTQSIPAFRLSQCVASLFARPEALTPFFTAGEASDRFDY